METTIQAILKEYPGSQGTSTVRLLRKTAKTMDLQTINVPTFIRDRHNRIRIDAFRILKALNYDVSQYEQELAQYEQFAAKLKQNNRRDLQTIFYNYYIPLYNKFGGELGLDLTNIDTKELKEFITPDRFPVTELLEKVLTMENAPKDVIAHVFLRKEFLEDVSSVRAVLRKYVLTTRKKTLNMSTVDLKKVLSTLPCKYNDIPSLSFEDGKAFVCNSYRANLICIRKLDILGAFKWPYMNEIQEYQRVTEEKLSIIDQVELGKLSGLQALMHLEKALQCDLFKIKDMNTQTLEDRLNEAPRANIIYTILLQYLGSIYMDQLDLQDHVIGVTLKDRLMKVADEWTKTLFQNIYRHFEVVSETTTSVVENNMKKIEYHMVVIFLDLIGYIPSDTTMQTFFHSATIEKLTDFMLHHGRNLNVQNERVKNQINTHHAKRRLFQILRIFKSEPLRNVLQIDPNIIKINTLLNKIENKRELNEERQPYTDEEIESLFSACEGDTKWTLILTIFREVGLRVGAVCNLKVSDVVNEFLQPKHEGRSLEKGNKIRKFIVGPNLKRKIVSYIHEYEKLIDKDNMDEQFMFGLEKGKRPGVSHLEAHLKIIAKKAGLTTNVYPHLFRHTLVKVLEDSGNTMNEISKFMGHSNVDTTQKWYSIRTLPDIVENMNNPFYDVSESPEEAQEEYDDELSRANTKLETCVSIISGMMDTICDEDKKKIFEKMPNIDKVMRVIVDSCAGSTTTYTSHSQTHQSFDQSAADSIHDFI